MAKIVIPKELDIEDVVEKDERERARAERKATFEARRQSFMQELKNSGKIKEQANKKTEKYCERIAAEIAEEKRKAEYGAIVDRKLREGR